MRKIKLFIIIALSVLLIGYIFKDEILYFDIGDTYYVISYFTIALYLVYLIILVFLIRVFIKKNKQK